jgi:hypothetical protein
MAVMPAEIRETVQLYLNGKIREWYSRGDGRGVVFLLDTRDVAEAHAIMEGFPLAIAGPPLPTCAMHKVVSYPDRCGRAGRATPPPLTRCRHQQAPRLPIQVLLDHLVDARINMGGTARLSARHPMSDTRLA